MPTITGVEDQPAQSRRSPRGAGQMELHLQENKLIASISHELQTPLTNLKMRLYLARKEPEKIGEHLGIMEAVTERMRLLVEDLLDVTRHELGAFSLAKQSIVFQELIANSIELQRSEAERKSITLSVKMPEYPVQSCVDPNRITQVLTNLIINAINYTPAGGEVRVLLSNQDGTIAICVCDNGIGIPDHLTERIFEPFFRIGERMVKGSGLGLTISRAIVEAHNGTITVTSKTGQGSIFRVQLNGECS